MSRHWLTLDDCVFQCVIGIFESEQHTPQKLQLELGLGLDLEPAAYGDLSQSVDYSTFLGQTLFIAQQGRWGLLESLGMAILRLLLAPPAPQERRGQVDAVRLRLSKPEIFSGRARPGIDLVQERSSLVLQTIQDGAVHREILQETAATGAYRIQVPPGAHWVAPAGMSVMVIAGMPQSQNGHHRPGDILVGDAHRIHNSQTAPVTLLGVSHPPVVRVSEASTPTVQSNNQARYDRIGHGYANTRKADPHIAQRIFTALGTARTVVNVGAGAGSYEPPDRYVIAVEPSDVMANQRPRELAPALRATAGQLPLRDGAVDAAMAILTIHHWDRDQERGVRELRRVTRGPVVILTCDPEVSGAMWLMADYLHEVGALDRRIFPSPQQLARWLGGQTQIEVLPISRDSPDWSLMSFWAHPERVLDAAARDATSGFARMDSAVVDRVVSAVQRDLSNGTWDARYGHLRQLDAYDAGLRLVINLPD